MCSVSDRLKLTLVIEFFVLSIFEWLFYTRFTVWGNYQNLMRWLFLLYVLFIKKQDFILEDLKFNTSHIKSKVYDEIRPQWMGH